MLYQARFYIVLLTLYLTTGCTSIAQASALKRFMPESSTWAALTPTLELNSAINETELLLFNLEGLQGHKVRIKLEPLDNSPITWQWFQVLQGSNTNGAIDALQEPDTTGSVVIQTNSSALLMKFLAPNSLSAGIYRWSMQILDNTNQLYQGTLALKVYPLKLETPTITLQGNLLFKRNDISEEIMLALLKTMHSYNFNSVILPKQFFKKASIGKVEQYVLDNFKYIRLSPRTLFSRNNTLEQQIKSEGITKSQWLKNECDYVNNLMQLMNITNKNKNTLVYKLWDEPLPINYPEVVYTYTGVHNCTKNLSLELTEEPSTALGDIADIWTVNLNALSEAAVQTARQQNDRIYLYANRLHDIQTNPQTIRNIGWLMGYFGLDGYHFWSVSDWGNGTLEQTAGDTANEERGTLFYWDSTANKLMSSLRMEMFQQGLEEMQLLGIVKKCAVSASKSSAKASDVLKRLAATMAKWNFSNGSDPGSQLIAYRSELLSTAVACNEVRMRRPLPWSNLNLR